MTRLRSRKPLLPVGALTAALLSGTLASSPGPASAATGTRVDVKVLLISSGADTSLQLAAWKKSLDEIGVPFDTFVMDAVHPITASTLEVDPQHGKYNAIILTDGTIMSNWNGAPAAQQEMIADYERSFGVREIADDAGPASGFGLDFSGQQGSPQALGVSATLTPAGQSVFGYLQPSVVVPYEAGLYMYLAAPYCDLPQWNGWGITDVTSFQTLVEGPTVSNPGDSCGSAPAAIVGVASHADGRQEMVTTVNSSDWTTSDKLLHIGMLDWVTKGVYLGSWRNYFSIDFDDVLLPDSRWSTAGHCTPGEDEGCTAAATADIRMTPADVQRAAAWTGETGIRLNMVFNGQGATPAENKGIQKGRNDALATALLNEKSAFGWVNHTWSHEDLDTAKLSTIQSEISKNQTWAQANKVPMNPAELVTGDHSGLANPAMPTALARTGVTTIAADASVNPAVRTLGPATVVPRHPTDLYYNVGTDAEQLDEFNWIYRNDPYVGAPVTWDQYAGMAADQMLAFVLANDPRPFFAHQNNLAEDGTFYPVADALLSAYDAWFRVPLVQPTLSEAGTILLRQAAWAGASASGEVTAYIQDGQVHLSSTVPVAVPLTGTGAGSAYGGVNTSWLTVGPSNPATVPLP